MFKKIWLGDQYTMSVFTGGEQDYVDNQNRTGCSNTFFFLGETQQGRVNDSTNTKETWLGVTQK